MVKLCSYGCGQEAKYQLKNGKWCCEHQWMKCIKVRKDNRKRMKENNPLNDPKIREKQKIANGNILCREKKRNYSLNNNVMHRPEIKEKHKQKMKELSGKNNPLYTNPDALEKLRISASSEECRKKKKEATKKAFIEGRHPMCFSDIILRMSISNSKPHEHTEKFKEYSEVVIQETNRSLIKHKKEIENYDLRGRKYGYELDHKYSISKGFEQKIDPKIIGHWKNLEILPKLKNRNKYTKCSIEINELLKIIRESEEIE